MDIERLIWLEQARWEEDYGLFLYARDRRGEAEEVGDDVRAEIWGEVESWAEGQEKISESRMKALRRSKKKGVE